MYNTYKQITEPNQKAEVKTAAFMLVYKKHVR